MRTVPRWSRQRARRLVSWARKLNDVDLFRRAQVVAAAARGQDRASIMLMIGCASSTVSRVLGRFIEGGREALLDGRRNNGPTPIPDFFVETVEALLWQSPLDYGHGRPTWTRELLLYVAEEQTGIRVSVSSMGRILKRLGARRGRPKPTVECPLSDRQRRRRLANIRRLLDELPADEVAVYEDEVDIHLNPKVGFAFLPRGHQKLLMTPGKNEKAYIAGTLDAREGTVLWVGETLKNSSLFIKMLRKLDSHYAAARRIHVIVDNYGIHKSAETKAALGDMPRIQLHFLPPYCPDENRIERMWRDLHDNVTRNHQHGTLEDLCFAVSVWLDAVSPWPPSEYSPCVLAA